MNPLASFLTVSCTGTGQATFYNSSKDQEKALADVHATLLKENRRAYALSVVLPINDKARQLVLQNLLNTGKSCYDQVIESNVIKLVEQSMQFNRLLNLFMDLREKKVNNSRTRNLGVRIWAEVDAFRAIKYANKLRTILRHCHIPEGTDPVKAEIHQWLFGKIKKADEIKHNPKLMSRLKAKTDYQSLFDLPFDIARDIAVASHKKTAEDFTREFSGKDGEAGKGKITKKESLRARAVTGDTAVDFNKFSVFELLMHAHRNEADKPIIAPIIDEKAKEIASMISLPDRVAVVFDNSTSALGSAERQFQPIATMEALLHIFKRTSSNVSVFNVGKPIVDGYAECSGASNLRRPLIQALLTRPDLLIILSDGYENVRAGSVNQILSTKAVRDLDISILHLNPVAAAEAGGQTRRLSEHAMTFALTDPTQLPMITLIGLAAQDQRLLDGMFNKIEQAMRIGDFKGARAAVQTGGLTQAMPKVA